jgi:uncharacterized protein (UPF0548 family)
VFTLFKPTCAEIEGLVEAAGQLPQTGPHFLSTQGRLSARHLPSAYAHDDSRTCIGHGRKCFAAARRAFEQWAMFGLGWVRIANPQALIVAGQIVAVEAHTLGLWSPNLSRIVDVTDTESRFGFLYATTEVHIEQGEERFLIEFDQETGQVYYELEAISFPRSSLARLGFPVTRAFQHKFARDSHFRMRETILGTDT